VAEDATECRRQLGELLRELRNHAGLTQIQAVERLDFRQPKLAKIEKARAKVTGRDLAQLLEAYEANDVDVQNARKLAARAGVGRVQDLLAPTLAFRQVLESECAAAQILSFHSARIPGPLQSEGYAVQQHRDWNGDELFVLLERRRARSKLFRVADPPRYRVVLDESSLYRLPGGFSSSKLLDLVDHLLMLRERWESLELQILRFEDDVAFVDTDVAVFQFAEDSPKKDFAYVEYPGDGRIVNEGNDVLKACLESWYACHRAARSVEGTRKFLEELRERAIPGISLPDTDMEPRADSWPPSVG
jgi:transcriptional regulator with XRE-family HTH domain